MKLKALLRGLEVKTEGSKEIEISGLSSDSKTVAPGNLFLAKKGEKHDGAACIPEAIRSGAAAVVTDLRDPFCKATQIIVENPSRFEAVLASRFYSYPSKDLYVIGTTGTKGKTTTTYLIHHILESLGQRPGLIGTVESIVATERRSSSLTTHFPIYNQKLLREMVVKGSKAAAIEVSSHGLEQGRVDQIEFDAAVFTNLYPDHLDYHQSINRYAEEKKKLFSQLDQSPKKKKIALFNADSDWTPYFREGVEAPSMTFGFDLKADLRAFDAAYSLNGSSFQVEFQGRKAAISLPLLGSHNIYNAMAAIGVGLSQGADLQQLSHAISTFSCVPGRLERVENPKGIHIFVDFAHTGEALDSVLRTLRAAAKGKMYCVFGCGGNRDPQRRSGMAKAAESWADLSILTTDNPRSEDPNAILREIHSAYTDPAKAILVIDRKEAIHRALSMAKAGDVVLIAGKGHEKTQIFARHTIAFDDTIVAKEFPF